MGLKRTTGLTDFARDAGGATAIEYSLILAMISFALLSSLSDIRTTLGTILARIGDVLISVL